MKKYIIVSVLLGAAFIILPPHAILVVLRWVGEVVILKYIIARWVGKQLLGYAKGPLGKAERWTIFDEHVMGSVFGKGHRVKNPMACDDGKCPDLRTIPA